MWIQVKELQNILVKFGVWILKHALTAGCDQRYYQESTYQVKFQSTAAWIKRILEAEVEVQASEATQTHRCDLRYIKKPDIGIDQDFNGVYKLKFSRLKRHF